MHLREMDRDIPKSVVDLNKKEDYDIEVQTTDQLSSLDILIQTCWQQKMDQGSFRYKFQHPQCKQLAGSRGYLAQFNPFRVSGRRMPQAKMNLNFFLGTKNLFNKTGLL